MLKAPDLKNDYPHKRLDVAYPSVEICIFKLVARRRIAAIALQANI